MATIKSDLQTAADLTVTGLTTLASATYCVSNAIIHSTNEPLDVLVKANVYVTAGAPTGNKQVLIFAKASLDGVNFTTGPESGTQTENEGDLHFVGSIPVATQSNVHSRVFSLASAYGGTLPRQTKLVIKNDCGQTLAAANVQYAEAWGLTA
jgi:hypothetical protein